MKNKSGCTQKHCLNIATLEITFLCIHHDRLSPTSHFVKSYICCQDEVVLSCCRYILLLFIIITKFLLVTFNFAINILCLSQCPLLSTERIAVQRRCWTWWYTGGGGGVGVSSICWRLCIRLSRLYLVGLLTMTFFVSLQLSSAPLPSPLLYSILPAPLSSLCVVNEHFSLLSLGCHVILLLLPCKTAWLL